jgi:hypothetical protein
LDRRDDGKDIREEVADDDYPPFPNNFSNGEENDYKDSEGKRSFIANYHKALTHHPLQTTGPPDPKTGEVERNIYLKFLKAVKRRNPDPYDFEDITLGSPTVSDPVKLTNPLAGVAFDLEGLDSHATFVPPAPRIGPRPSSRGGGADNGAESAGEMAELYWMVLCRDVHFRGFATDSLIQDAIDDLSTNYTRFPVPPYPPSGRPIDTNTIFRGFTNGDVQGPYISQFLLKGSNDLNGIQTENQGYIKYGSLVIDQRQWTVKPIDYLADYQEWLNVQDGAKSPPTKTDPCCGNNYDTSQRRFIRNMRDLANYVHFDDLPQEFVNACLILLHIKAPCINPQPTFDPGNPYVDDYQKQVGFGTFGPQHILTLVAEATTRAIKAAWYHKWFVHRRLRPEAFGGLIHRQLNNQTSPPLTPNLSAPNPPYPIHNDILGKTAPDQILGRIRDKHGTYLLPQAFPEGSPTHPSYPAGHATIAGACVTILKAFFDGGFRIKNPVQANADGTALENYPDQDKSLTVGGELDKLASNISLGRNMAGVHYRSDHTQSLFLGESVGISILKDQARTFREGFSFRFQKFDGTIMEIHNR